MIDGSKAGGEQGAAYQSKEYSDKNKIIEIKIQRKIFKQSSLINMLL